MTTSMRVGHYDVLGVAPDATEAQLKAAYRAKLKTAHPDSGGSDEAFEALQVAWSVVGDPERRREYDAWLEDVRPVMGGSRLAVQQRFEERELAVERAAWDARRAEARRKADRRAESQRAAAEAEYAQWSEHVGLHRLIVLAVAALVVVVSAVELLVGVAPGDGPAVVFGTELPLPPEGAGALMAQMVLGLLLALGAILSGPPTLTERNGSDSAQGTHGATWFHSGAFRVALGTAAALLTLVVLVPFVLAVI